MFILILIHTFCIILCLVFGIFDVWFLLKFMNDLMLDNLAYDSTFILCGITITFVVTFIVAISVATIRYIDTLDIINEITELKYCDIDFTKPEPPADPFKKTEKNE